MSCVLKISLLCCLILSSPLLAEKDPFPTIVEFGEFKSNQFDPFYEPDSWRLGQAAFNFAPDIAPFFLFLKQAYKIDTVIETGTNVGATTLYFSLLFDNVHTIEIDPHFYKEALENLKMTPNVKCHLGDSKKILPELLPSLKNNRLLFYLDAHWHNDFPLNKEIRIIAETHKNNCILVIDDFQVKGREDLQFDAWGEESCTFVSIRPALETLFTDYTVHYVIPKSLKAKAKFVAIPKQWNQ